MAEVVLELDRVWKKFRRGEIHDSLRDLIPALTGRLMRRQRSLDLGESEFWALRDISFAVERGEALGIVGHNGAGKSTILKILSRILRPTAGTMNVKGRLSALIEVSAGFHPDLTGRENIYLNGAILGMNRDEIRSKFDQIVEFSGLGEFIDTPVKRYSSGMFARLGFSVAAHVSPDVLIVDEVLSVGDYAFQRRCLERMRAVIKGGATVIFVSHNLRAVTELCPRSVLLDHGRMVEDGPTGHVVQTYLERMQSSREEAMRGAVYIKSVNVRGAQGHCVQFRSGERAWVDIEVRANEPSKNVAVVIGFRDEEQYGVFDTSTERLGYAPVDLEAGESYRVTFELKLNFAYGSFGLGVWLYRYDIQHDYDSWVPATTIFISPDQDVRGAVNLEPRIVEEVRGDE